MVVACREKESGAEMRARAGVRWKGRGKVKGSRGTVVVGGQTVRIEDVVIKERPSGVEIGHAPNCKCAMCGGGR